MGLIHDSKLNFYQVQILEVNAHKIIFGCTNKTWDCVLGLSCRKDLISTCKN